MMFSSKPAAILLSAAICGMLTLAACEKKPVTNTTPKTAAGTPAALPGDLFLTAAPPDAKPVEAVKAAAPKVGDTVAISGRIGGSRNPFVDGKAAFTLMGPELKACSDVEGDGCKYPWDYCCEKKEDIAAHSALIQVVDASGAPIRAGLKGEKGLKELSKVVVVGKVTQVEGPNMVINATGIYLN